MLTQKSEKKTTASPAAAKFDPDPKEIQELAYQLWVQRGRPEGTALVDWARAEEELRKAYQTVGRAA